MAEPSRKRPADDAAGNILLYSDPNELVNAVISCLAGPEQITIVAETYANDKNLATEVQAYAKIAGSNWTYYVKSLSVSIGRNTEQVQPSAEDAINIDLGPSKVVSRSHAAINYNQSTRSWDLYVSGRNGAKVDTVKVPCGPNSTPTPLKSGAVVDIGGTQMMFILPDAQPALSPAVLDQVAPRLPAPKSKKVVVGVNTTKNTNGGGMKAFQSFGPSDDLKDHSKRINGHGNDSSGADSGANSPLKNDLSMDEARDIKPPYSYATMITQAILSNPEGVLSLSEIYDWIAYHYAFYRFSKSGWQNSIRHNLSLNKAFEKVPRKPSEPGKGMKWQISDSYKDEFMRKFQSGSLSKARRGSSVSRQLQLHLITHNDLPVSQSQRRKVTQQHYMNPQPMYQQHVPPPQQQQPHHQPTNSHEALQFMAQAATNGPGYNGPRYGNNTFVPTQLPPLQQQQQPQPHPQQGQLPTYSQGLYGHSRNSSLGANGPFPSPFPPMQQHDPHHSQGPQSMHPPVQQTFQSIPPPHQQQPPQQQASQPPVVPKQEDVTSGQRDTSEQKTSTETSSQSFRPTTNDTNLSTDGTVIKPETRDEAAAAEPPAQFSSPAKKGDQEKEVAQPDSENAQQQAPLYAGKFYNDDSHNTTETQKDHTTTDFGLLNSPSKAFSVTANEAYTPDRGARKKDDESRHANLQSSPALWNFVQFSTPLQPGLKSPMKNGMNNISDSPLKNKTEARTDAEGNENLANVDLAKGFDK